MTKLLKYMTLALVAGILLYGFGAAAEDIFEKAFNVTATVFKNVRFIVYIIGGFGLIGLAVAAILGKMQFKWLVYVAMGLAIVAAADLVVSYATSDARKASGSASFEWDDALMDDTERLNKKVDQMNDVPSKNPNQRFQNTIDAVISQTSVA